MANLKENECLVETIKNHTDMVTKKRHSPTDKNKVRKVTKERGAALIAAGVCKEFIPTV